MHAECRSVLADGSRILPKVKLGDGNRPEQKTFVFCITEAGLLATMRLRSAVRGTHLLSSDLRSTSPAMGYTTRHCVTRKSSGLPTVSCCLLSHVTYSTPNLESWVQSVNLISRLNLHPGEQRRCRWSTAVIFGLASQLRYSRIRDIAPGLCCQLRSKSLVLASKVQTYMASRKERSVEWSI